MNLVHIKNLVLLDWEIAVTNNNLLIRISLVIFLLSSLTIQNQTQVGPCRRLFKKNQRTMTANYNLK